MDKFCSLIGRLTLTLLKAHDNTHSSPGNTSSQEVVSLCTEKEALPFPVVAVKLVNVSIINLIYCFLVDSSLKQRIPDLETLFVRYLGCHAKLQKEGSVSHQIRKDSKNHAKLKSTFSYE